MTKVLEYLTKSIAWLQIAISPFILGAIAGLFIYAYRTDTYGLIMAGIVTLIGLIIGIIWATRVWKRRGTIEFISKVNASPELDNKQTEPTH